MRVALKSLSVLAAFSFAVACAHADVITFASGITTTELMPSFSNGCGSGCYTDSSYDVKDTSGTWYVNEYQGNPPPGIDTYNSASNSITITNVDGAGSFAFNSFQVEDTTGNLTYTVTGYEGATQVYSVGGSLTATGCVPTTGGVDNACLATNPFQTINSGEGSVDVTSAVITFALSPAANSDAYLDNISVSDAPEPASFVLLGTGLLGLAGVARRRFVR